MSFSHKMKLLSNFVFDKVFMFINPDQFETLLTIFTKKYGEPKKRDDSKIQNRMGAEFLQSEVLWEKGDRGIILYKYADKIDEGRAIFLSMSEINENKEKADEKNEEAADIL